MTKSSNHIAILVLDTPIPQLNEKFGDFGDLTVKLLNQANAHYELPYKKYQLKSDDPQFLNDVYSELNQNIQNNYVKGFVLTGSRSDSFVNDIEWINRLNNFIIEVLFHINQPLVGICFGHQILCKNLGCRIDRNEKGWELGITTIKLNNEIFKLKHSPFLKSLSTEIGNKEELTLMNHLNLIEFHQDIVYGLPIGLTDRFLNIGSTSNCSIQGIITSQENKDAKILTFQGHPEFSSEYSLELLKQKYETGLIDQKSYEKAKYHTQTLNNQGVAIGKVILNFIDDNRH